MSVLRADVDNLGKTFMSGFVDKKGNDRYVTLSRTATLSRQLSLFFKYYISSILVQKFLNKWTIFLFCSILFSSNQKEH